MGLAAAEANIRRRERLLTEAERIAGFGSWELDLGKRRARWSDQTFRLLGLQPTSDGLSVDSFLTYVYQDDRELVQGLFARAARGEILRTEADGVRPFRVLRIDGEIRWLWTNVEAVRDAAGVPRRLVGVLRDVTTSVDQQRQLEQKHAELEEANKRLAEFAYVVSHDLKAPLRGIGSLADWIARDNRDRLDEDGKEQLDLLLGRVRRMNDLIDGILRYSRVGRSNEERCAVDLAELVPQVVDLVSPPPHVVVEVDAALPVVVVSRTQIAQVFQNLVGNALKFADKPAARVRVAYVATATHHRFEVRDNGPGIEPRHHERIFQLFQTLKPRDKSEGTGIGLSIVKKIVESYGGAVGLTSTVGEGTTFFFTLPQSLSAAAVVPRMGAA